MQYRIGLDIGIGSVGYAVLEYCRGLYHTKNKWGTKT